jgi:hypothetical protein
MNVNISTYNPTLLTGSGKVVSPETTADKSTQGKREETQGTNSQELDRSEQRKLKKLEQRDQEVRQHEQAHVQAAGSLLVSGPHYEYVTGPDGNRYVINGHVNLDVSPEEEPKETARKADRIVRAALAPMNPSSDDYAIANNARRMKAKALQEVQREQRETQNNQQAEQAYKMGKSLRPDLEIGKPSDSRSYKMMQGPAISTV